MFYGSNVEEVVLPASLENFDSPYFISFSHVETLDMSAATKITEMPEYFAHAQSYVDTSSGSEYAPSTNAYLTTVKLPASMKNISVHAFYYCQKLEHIEMPAALEKIDNYAFYYCQALKEMEIPEGVKSIGNYAFYYVTTCKYVTVPATVRTLGTYVFYSNTNNVLDIYMEAEQDNGPTMGSYAFSSNTRVHWGTKGPMFLDATMWDAEDANERYAAYFFNANGEGGSTWVDLTDKGDGLWAAAVPTGYDSVIFVRMNGETSENNWDNKWNQTGDLSANNVFKTYTIEAWGENGAPSTGSWN